MDVDVRSVKCWMCYEKVSKIIMRLYPETGDLCFGNGGEALIKSDFTLGWTYCPRRGEIYYLIEEELIDFLASLNSPVKS